MMSDDTEAPTVASLIEGMQARLRAANPDAKAPTVADLIEVTKAEAEGLEKELRARRAARLAAFGSGLPWPTLDEAQQPKPRKRKPTLAGVARQVARAGIEVARYEVRADGTIGVVPGKPSETTTPDNNDTNEWDSVLQ